MADNLERAAHIAIQIADGAQVTEDKSPRHNVKNSDIKSFCNAFAESQKFVRGLYSGGTFSYEAMLLLNHEIGPMNSSSPLSPENKLNDIWTSTGHTIIDLGDDLFTRGRPHPMIDHQFRNDRILQEVQDPEVAVILLDIVIGYGSHNDPAGEMAGSIIAAKEAAEKSGTKPVFVTFVCGTEGDPQNLSAQERKLRDVGAIVVESNAQAVRLTSDILSNIGGK